MKLTWDQYVAQLDRQAKEFGPGMVQAQRLAVRDAARLLRVKSLEPATGSSRGGVYTGAFARSWHAEDTETGAALVNDAGHAESVEYGRDPGSFPPLNELREWVQRKLGKSGAELDRVTYLIGRAIAERGIPGRYLVEGNLPAILMILARYEQRAMDKVFSK